MMKKKLAKKPACKSKKPAVIEPEPQAAEEPETQRIERKTKTFKWNGPKLTVQEICDVIHPHRYTEIGGILTIEGGNITSQPVRWNGQEEFLRFNSIYDGIVINSLTKTVSVWRVGKVGRPDWIFEDILE